MIDLAGPPANTNSEGAEATAIRDRTVERTIVFRGLREFTGLTPCKSSLIEPYFRSTELPAAEHSISAAINKKAEEVCARHQRFRIKFSNSHNNVWPQIEFPDDISRIWTGNLPAKDVADDNLRAEPELIYSVASGERIVGIISAATAMKGPESRLPSLLI